MSNRNLILAAAGAVGGDYQISRSLRFNSADSAYLSRTPASAGNRKTWTWSSWVKRSDINSAVPQQLFAVRTNPTPGTLINFDQATQGNVFRFEDLSSSSEVRTTQTFRDVSAWYHVVVAIDTTQATASNRVKLYVNGTQVTALSTANYPAQNTDTAVNAASEHNIGRQPVFGNYLTGYMTEINFIDGQALDPSSFGEFNATTGVWQPIEYTGTYGTNGFYLNFSDNTSTTTLGDDLSGNGNDWTTNNFSVTAGAGNDSLVDSPTRYGTDTGAGGTVRGNYCTWNAVLNPAQSTLTNGNLDAIVNAGGGGHVAVGTIGVTTGKWYWEVYLASEDTSPSNAMIGICDLAGSPVYNWASAFGWTYYMNGQKYHNASGSAYGTSYVVTDTIGVALNMDTGEVTFYKNGASQGVAFNSGLSGKTIAPMIGTGSSSSGPGYIANFGQRPFEYTAPSGFKALVTTNLPDPTIVEGDDYFNTVLYTGTGSSLGVTGVGFQPDWVWIKERNAAADHGLYDAVRGVQEQLESNNDTAETTEATGLTAFGADGFTVGALAQLNTSADTYVAWNWKANGAGVSNTDGTISSTVSANTTAGISIVTYTGNGSAGATVGHGLGVAPSMMIMKPRSAISNWVVYHSFLGNTKVLYLDTTNAEITSSLFFDDTSPTSSVFTLGSGTGLNGSGTTYVAYCFAEVEGFSKFGSFVGNGSADGPFAFLGFRPAFVMLKRTDSTSNWTILDSKRLGYNIDVGSGNNPIFPNLADAETTTNLADLTSNGFKLRSTDASVNASTATYIYAAFAISPFKLSLAR
jgi:hypothetical protein